MINVAELDERIDRCLAILADNPHSQVFAALAEAYRRRGEFGRAFSVCKSGLKHHPDYAPAHVVLAKLYLHQKMLPDALSSLMRAVELDGPTRVTDILEAEIQLALGDVKAAQTVLERLRITDPGNSALPDLIGQVKRLRSDLAAPVVAAPVEPTPQPWPRANADARPAPDCADWPTWVKTLGVLRDVDFVFVSDVQGRIIAKYPESDAAQTRVDTVLSMLREITAQFPQGVWGSVCEIRIETGHGDVWVNRLGDTVVGLAGLSNLKFGETRRRGLDLAARVQDQPSVLDASTVAES
jgi:tetratricopeptide (TPR) repeat protein